MENKDKRLSEATLGDLDDFYGKYHCELKVSLGYKVLQYLGCDEQDLHLEERDFQMFQLVNVSDAVVSFFEGKKLKYNFHGIKGGYGQEGVLATLFSGQLHEIPAVKTRAKVSVKQERAVLCDVLFSPEIEQENTFIVVLMVCGHSGYNQRLTVGFAKKNTENASEQAQQFFNYVQDWISVHNCFRRQAIQPVYSHYGMGISGYEFIEFPLVRREHIILDDSLWDVLHRNLMLFYEQRGLLKQSRISLKRGILLSGDPGTGKTLLCQYIVNAFKDYTTLYVPTVAATAISSIVSMAKSLQPALLILEDVDLIAEDRNNQNMQSKAILGELMNQMDGFSIADDIVFLFTTNNLESIEPAIIARPGRIDQIISLPKPNPELRHKLFQLYADGIDLQADMGKWIKRTENFSPAAIRELIKKACSTALISASKSDGKIKVGDKELESALSDLKSQLDTMQTIKNPTQPGNVS